ncbi:MAG: 50S ribosomal protein L25/general stress protein Ctc [Mariprofundales bacterium]|nr:50S ribosomal protein L25/general stress protein Ctc [Mariprofundales bacterium]
MGSKASSFKIDAVLREHTGKSAARRLRHAGKVPAVIYGADKPDLPIVLDDIAMRKPLDNEAFYTSLISIDVQGKRGIETVLLKDAQWHPVRDVVMHLDFFRVSADDVVSVEVPLHPLGGDKCPGVVQGGHLDLIRHTLEVTCKADMIPDSIMVDCSALELGSTIHVQDLTLPEGVEPAHEGNFTILNLSAPKGVVEEDEEGAETADEAPSEE